MKLTLSTLKGLDFCADLATRKDLAELTPGEWMLLKERYCDAYRAFYSHIFMKKPTPNTVEPDLKRLHRWLQDILVPLVDAPFGLLTEMSLSRGDSGESIIESGAVELTGFLNRVADNASPWFIVLSGSGEVTIQSAFGRSGSGGRPPRFETRLWQFIKPGSILPFARCPWCKRVFVVSKRPQRFCSPNCMVESGREVRRKQVREAVRRHRAKKQPAPNRESS